MLRSQSKTTKNINNQENKMQAKEENKFPITNLKEMEICELTDK